MKFLKFIKSKFPDFRKYWFANIFAILSIVYVLSLIEYKTNIRLSFAIDNYFNWGKEPVILKPDESDISRQKFYLCAGCFIYSYFILLAEMFLRYLFKKFNNDKIKPAKPFINFSKPVVRIYSVLFYLAFMPFFIYFSIITIGCIIILLLLPIIFIFKSDIS